MSTNKRTIEEFALLPGEEIQERRKASMKIFDLGAGKRQAIVYGQQVHFQHNGKWLDIDNTLIEDKDPAGNTIYRNKANDIHYVFSAEPTSERFLTVQHGNIQMEFAPAQECRFVEGLVLEREERKGTVPQDEREVLPQIESAIKYDHIYPGLSLQYTILGRRLLEKFTLDNAEAWAGTAIRMRGEGLSLTPDEAGGILVTDEKTGEDVFRLSGASYMDATDTWIRNLETRVSSEDGWTIIQYALPEGESGEDLAYPVTIDPVLYTTQSASAVDDTTVMESAPSTNYGSASEMAIGTYNNATNAALIRFTSGELPKLFANDTIISGQLKVIRNASQAEADKYIAAYGIATSWSETGATWNNFNINSTAYVESAAQDFIYSTLNSDLYFDLTNLVRKWYMLDANAVSLNRGVCLKKPSYGVTGGNYQKIYSSDSTAANCPRLIINYISHAGVENWWTYDSMDLGRSGTGYVDLFNGSMVWCHTDTVMTGLKMPVSIIHTYNTAYSHLNSYGCGYGWRLNWNQSVLLTTIAGISYAIWTDGDGTNHYFNLSGSAPYKDSEGMGLTYSKIAASSTDVERVLITDKGGNILRFEKINDRYHLKRMQDVHGAKAIVSAYSGIKPTEITDHAGRKTTLAYTNGLLSSITIPGEASGTTRTISFAYSGNKLSTITYWDGAGSTSFVYGGTTNMLRTVTGPNALRVNITYVPGNQYNAALFDVTDANSLRRVRSLEFESTSGTKGAKRLYTYNDVTTEVMNVTSTSSDTEGKKLVYQFNDRGNVISVRDELGFAKYTGYSDSVVNKPSDASKLQKGNINYLQRVDFKSGWSVSGNTSGSDSISVNTATPCNGVRTLRVKKVATNTTILVGQTVTLERGKTYTFSAYVKGTLPTNGSTSLYIRMGIGGSNWVSSEMLTASPIASGELGYDGWYRLMTTLSVPTASGSTSASVTCQIVLGTGQGDIYIGCPQLEEGEMAGHVNLLTNSNFRNADTTYATMPADWTIGSDVGTGSSAFGLKDLTGAPATLSGKCMQFRGEANKANMYIRQELSVAGASGDVFVLGGWAYGVSAPVTAVKRFGFSVRFGNGGSYGTEQLYMFNAEDVGWQYASFSVIAPTAYDSILIDVTFARNINIAQFANLHLYKEAYGQSFTYDTNGNIVTASTYAGQKSQATYDSYDNLTGYVPAGRNSSEKYTISYGSNPDKHLPVAEKSPCDVYIRRTYSSLGHQTSESIVNYAERNNANPTMIGSETGYDSTDNYATTWKDARGNTVTREANPRTGTTAWQQGPIGAQVNYTYDTVDRVTGTSATQNSKNYKNSYTYSQDRIASVNHNTTSDTMDVSYTFQYNAWGGLSSVKIGSQTLVTRNYSSDRQRLLTSEVFGNNGRIDYTYDEWARLTQTQLDSDPTKKVTYQYGNHGALEKIIDAQLGRTTLVRYDLAGREMEREVRATSGNTLLYRHRVIYDACGNISSVKERVNIGSGSFADYTRTYAYDSDNRVTSVIYTDATHKTEYTYDALGRVSTRKIYNGSTTPVTETYTYAPGATSYSTNATTGLVSGMSQTGMTQSYAYDANGNITSWTCNGLACTYGYDSLGQLIRVNDQKDTTASTTGTTWLYEYDRGGNITAKKGYAYTTGTVGTLVTVGTLTYNSTWKDLLATLNGFTQTPDAIGNLTTDATWAYTWEGGRRLAQMSKSGMTVAYAYNENGLRVRKTVTTTSAAETEYTWQGAQVMHAKTPQGRLHFYYDGSRPSHVDFNGTLYTYVYSLQGDVLGLRDASGTLVVQYRYDAWGKQISKSGTLAGTLGTANPFRYRGYIYDEETQLYYLQTRYYSPNRCRFISPDSLLGKAGGLLQHNLFCYCKNEPVIKTDTNGHLATRAWYASIVGFIVNTMGLVDQSELLQLSEDEKYFLYSHPIAAKKIKELDCKSKAEKMTRILFGEMGNQTDGTVSNAFKHAYWSAILTRYIGEEYAEAITDLHELSVDPNIIHQGFYNQQHSEMDYYYNSIGREAAILYDQLFETYDMYSFTRFVLNIVLLNRDHILDDYDMEINWDYLS